MLLFQLTANLRKLKNRGGLAFFGKPRSTTGFDGLGMLTFHRDRTEDSPKKNEVSDFGFPTPCHN